jgi:2'-5' RNA ligase
MARLFVAVRPPPAVITALAGLDRPAEPGGRYAPPEQWHVTLRFLGDAVVDDAVVALEQLRSPVAEAVLGPRVSRLGRNVVCIPVAGLDELAAEVRELTATIGDPPDPRGFTGHLTIARLRGRAACGVAGAPFSARFAVHEVELVDSTLSSSGAVHEVVARRSLG